MSSLVEISPVSLEKEIFKKSTMSLLLFLYHIYFEKVLACYSSKYEECYMLSLAEIGQVFRRDWYVLAVVFHIYFLSFPSPNFYTPCTCSFHLKPAIGLQPVFDWKHSRCDGFNIPGARRFFISWTSAIALSDVTNDIARSMRINCVSSPFVFARSLM